MAQKFSIDPSHTTIGFGVKHMAVTTVRGRFRRFAGEVEVENGDPTTARGAFAIETASIDTDNEQRDAHLRSGDFFDAATHPELTYVIREVVRDGEGYRVLGELTMHGVTKPVELRAAVEETFVDPWGNQRVAISASGSLNRVDWGLKWNQTLEAGRLLVSEKVTLQIEGALVAPVAADEPAATTA